MFLTVLTLEILPGDSSVSIFVFNLMERVLLWVFQRRPVYPNDSKGQRMLLLLKPAEC